MSILVNLLPDLRQARARERKRKQLATGVSFAIWIACGAVLVLLGLYTAGQKVIISTTTKSIADKKQQLEKVPGLLDALNAEYDLESLPGLYDKRVYMTKFFQAYAEADPKSVTLSSVSVDAQRILSVTGAGSSYADLAKLARALEASNTTIGTGANAGNEPYFTDVTLSSLAATSGGKVVNFKLTAQMGSGVTNGNK